MRRIGMITVATAGALVIAASAMATVPSAQATGAFVAPHPDRVIAGPSNAGVSAWGLAYNPFSGELAIGDYVANQIRRFSLDGRHLGDFTNPKGTTQGVPSGLAVDPRNGDYYLAIAGDGATSRNLRKYNKDGQFLFDVSVSGSITWVAVDAAGNVWYPGAFGNNSLYKYRINDSTKTATQLGKYGVSGSGPCQLKRLTGTAIAPDGRVFVSDVLNKVLHVYSPSGTCVTDVGAGYFAGDLRGVAFDSVRNRLYVSDAAGGQIEVFDGTTYAHLATLSSLGNGPGQLTDGARGLTLTPDGTLWAADYGGRRVLVFGADGTYQRAIPDPPLPADPGGLADARGLAIDPTNDEVLIADSWNQRVLRYAPDGTLLQTFGHRGSQPPDGMNYPKSLAVEPTTGKIWVANYEGNPDVVVSTPGFASFVARLTPPRFTTDVEMSNGIAYLVNRRPGGVLRYDIASRTYLNTFAEGLGLLRGIAIDEVGGVAWITSDAKKELYIVSLATGSRLATLALPNIGWGVAIKGDQVFVASVKDNAIDVYDRVTRARIGTFGGTGTGPGQLSGPSAIAFDSSGALWVLEERNARAQRFSWDAPRTDDARPPKITLDTTAGTTNQIEVSGTASDSSGVFSVSVDIERPDGLHWNASTTTWGPKGMARAIVEGDITSARWHYRLVPTKPGDTYVVTVQALDFAGAKSRKLTASFTAP